MNNSSRTNWDVLASMSDDEIDYSDIPPLDDDFFDKAVVHIPAAQARDLVQLDPDVSAWFVPKDRISKPSSIRCYETICRRPDNGS